MSKWNLGENSPSEEIRAKMSNVDAAIALTLLENLDENLRLRQERADLYQELLGGHKRIQLIPHRSGSAYLSQVASFRTAQAGEIERLLEKLKENGFEICRSYTPLHVQPQFKQFARQPLTTVDKTWPLLFELPCEPGVRIREIQNLCSLIL